MKGEGWGGGERAAGGGRRGDGRRERGGPRRQRGGEETVSDAIRKQDQHGSQFSQWDWQRVFQYWKAAALTASTGAALALKTSLSVPRAPPPNHIRHAPLTPSPPIHPPATSPSAPPPLVPKVYHPPTMLSVAAAAAVRRGASPLLRRPPTPVALPPAARRGLADAAASPPPPPSPPSSPTSAASATAPPAPGLTYVERSPRVEATYASRPALLKYYAAIFAVGTPLALYMTA